MRFVTKSVSETLCIAKEFGQTLLKRKTRKPIIIGLSGELGSGKTTFVKGLAKGLGIKEQITSPTFILISRFALGKKRNFYHIDPYRLKDWRELIPLGLEDIVNDERSIVVIEWGERLKEYLPKDTPWVQLKHKGQGQREILINAEVKMKGGTLPCKIQH